MHNIPDLKKRGRPRTYSEALVLALWAFKQIHGLTWRKLANVSRQTLSQVPDFSTLFYRVKRIPKQRMEEFNRWLADRASEERR